MAAPVLVVLLLPWPLQAQVPAPPQATVTIYRCTDARGRETLQDAPCAKGQKQEERAMAKPVDAPKPPRVAAPTRQPTAPPAAPSTVVRNVYLAPPRPLYECTTPEGKRYTSDDGRGNPRWVPLWTLGYPTVRPRSVLGSNIGNPGAQMHPPPHDIIWPVATGGGTWVRDNCAILPPREACARLRDRRSAIRDRFFNAMPSERDVLRVEERGINARLDNDCGGA